MYHLVDVDLGFCIIAIAFRRPADASGAPCRGITSLIE
jgi:hypothetical protein